MSAHTDVCHSCGTTFEYGGQAPPCPLCRSQEVGPVAPDSPAGPGWRGVAGVTRDQRELLAAVSAERARQDLQLGGPAYDDERTDVDWHRLLSQYLLYVLRADDRPERRRRLVQVAALALAAVEASDRAARRRRHAPEDPPDA